MSPSPGDNSNAPVDLTDEERLECEAMLRSLIQTDHGAYAMKEELIDSFKRGIVALCMMGRAERFLIQAGCGSLEFPMRAEGSYRPEYGERACDAAAKACGIFPLSIYFYDFGQVLQQVGRSGEAKLMFQEFLRRLGNEAVDPVMQATLKRRDLDQAVHYVHQYIGPA